MKDRAASRVRSAPVVRTQAGPVVGIGGPVHAFLGIPYAAPPVGELRWRAPQRVTPWRDERPALQFGDDFPQAPNTLLRAARRSEDCLYLNVWTPADASPGSLPVLVWLHGGGFVAGSGSDVRCDGAAFAAAGAVVVTLNYRSGLFGFFAHPSLSNRSPSGTSGNYGLLDQIAALQWVRDNITAFGGAPERVSLFGVSAGSASIALLLTCPQARGLFQRAMLHSPGTCRPLASLADAEAAGLRLGDDIDALRRLDANALFAKTPLLVPAMRGLTTPRVLRPIRDGWLVPQDELAAFDAGRFQPMPLLLGTNEDEGTKLTASWTVTTRADYDALLASSFGPLAAQAAALYPADDDAGVRARVGELFGDTQFNYGTWRLGCASADAGQPTYRYVFRRRRPGLADGPHHGDEVAYVFDTLDLQRAQGGFDVDDTDRAVAAAMHGAWLRFAQTGDPNGGDLPTWPRLDRQGQVHLAFGDAIVAGSGWRVPQMHFLDAFSHRAATPLRQEP